MRSIGIAIALVVCVCAAPVWAEHRALEDVGDNVSRGSEARGDVLDVELQLGRDSFRLGGRFSGAEGTSSTRLEGRLGARGLEAGGRVERADGRAWNFQLDAGLMDRLVEDAWRWFRDRPLKVSE